MEQLRLTPVSSVSGEVTVPGSKSLSNRALLLAALAKGTTRVTNLLDSDDIRHMLDALSKLGIKYQLSECKTICEVTGNAGVFNVAQPVELYLGNAGTAMRPLCAALAASEGEFILGGEPRMEERPIGSLVETLQMAGADIQYLKNTGYPPLKINGKPLAGGSLKIDGSISSQFLTAVLMIAPLFNDDTLITVVGELVSKPYIEITLAIMAQFGIEVENRNYQEFLIKGNQSYLSPGEYMVEGDASSASYFLAAGAIKGGTVKVYGVGEYSVQGDIRFADVLEKMGAKITWSRNFIQVDGADLNAVDMDMNHIPDAAMTIAVAALFAKGTTTIRNIYNWRVKETDRLAAMATELRKLGVEVEEGEDYISVTPQQTLQEAQIDTYNDHRVAMCFSLVSLSDTAVVINDPGCTSKTFPDYFQRLATICQ
ncbi:3-phosphoshikimate 1-carboxyvinyltransferase [Planctobacterium marinum]|uniref:3-phosphoshikimate 1-carboxyvinyltransferase n=1 Tax=Planctobacterium marinum TaxID=1631968 RepID=A0AA48KQM9_9ALTE|nr:3-phosphoshikimate 1-carboxyvinyltransferase [Planctobacterium marinum]